MFEEIFCKSLPIISIARKNHFIRKGCFMLIVLLLVVAGFGQFCPTPHFFDTSSYSAGPGYPSPSVSVSCTAGKRNNCVLIFWISIFLETGTVTVTSNDIPPYNFVQMTPNNLVAQNIQFSFTNNPSYQSSPKSIVNVLGQLGLTITGLHVYGPTEGFQPAAQALGDPVHNQLVDTCGGHTGPQGEYHNHKLVNSSYCFPQTLDGIIGFAQDGYPIMANSGYFYKSGYTLDAGQNPTSEVWAKYSFTRSGPDVLDECNGRKLSSHPNYDYAYYITEGKYEWSLCMRCS